MAFSRARFSALTQIALWCFFMASVNLVFSIGLTAQVASGLDSTESSTAFPPDSTTDQLFADSTYQGWRRNNHNRGARLVGAWPCTSAGCIIFSDTNSVNANVYPEKALNHPGTAGMFC